MKQFCCQKEIIENIQEYSYYANNPLFQAAFSILSFLGGRGLYQAPFLI